MGAVPTKQIQKDENYVKMAQIGRIDHWMTLGNKSTAGRTWLHQQVEN